MKKFRHVNVIVLSFLTFGIIIGCVFAGCGKLSNDTDRPTDPVGTTGGSPLPVGPQSSRGTYTLSISADSARLPADNLNYTHVRAKLSDTSGRALQNFSIVFESDPIGNLTENHLPLASVFTDANGEAAVRFYGEVSGECAVQASVDIDSDGAQDLFVNTVVTLMPGGPPSSAGSYTLTIKAYPETIPADMATFSTIVAELRDSTGGSVENFTITFIADLGYLVNSPTGPGAQNTTITAVTNHRGSASVHFYGARAGSAVITASAFVNDLVGTLQAKKVIILTEGPGAPGPGNVAGVDLSIDSAGKIADLGSCSDITPQDVSFTLTATVWDESGNRVGPGVRVELSGVGINRNLNFTGETNSAGTVDFTYTYTISVQDTYELSATATVIINGQTYQDTVNYTIVGTCDVPTPTPVATATPTSTPTSTPTPTATPTATPTPTP